MLKLRVVHLNKVHIEFTGMSDRSRMIKVKKILSIAKTKQIERQNGVEYDGIRIDESMIDLRRAQEDKIEKTR